MQTEHPAPDPAGIGLLIGGGALAGRPYRDLCSTCNRTEACGGRSTPERPVFFCEEFDAAAPAAAAQVWPVEAARPARQPGKGQRKGLCMNCEGADTCTAATAEGGIWHCEEYR